MAVNGENLVGGWSWKLLEVLHKQSSNVNGNYFFVTFNRFSLKVLVFNTSGFYPTVFKGCAGIVFTQSVRIGGQTGRWVGRWCEKVCSGCISETIRCRMLKLGRDIGGGCRFATSWCDLDLTFDLDVVTLIFKILSRLYLCKVLQVDTWLGHWIGVCLQCHGVTFDLTIVTLSYNILSWLYL